MPARYLRAVPYQDDVLNLPVADVDAAIPFYEQTFGFAVESRSELPHKSAILARDDIRIGLAENGGDPTQEGSFIEVDDLEAAFQAIKGQPPGEDDLDVQDYYGTAYRVFFVVAPDGLCYMLGQPVAQASTTEGTE